jgi:transcriptional regulator with XRE-family HTH domain
MVRKRKQSVEGRGNSIRAWRGALSLERLADRVRELGVPITAASLSRIERGLQPYEQRKLEAIAIALGCEPSDLLMRTPTSKSQIELLSVVKQLKPEHQATALRLIKALAAA